MVDLTNISAIPGNECLGDSRARINDNVSLLKGAIEDLRTTFGLLTAYTLTGNLTTATSVTADNLFLQVEVNSGTGTVMKYLRLFDV